MRRARAIPTKETAVAEATPALLPPPATGRAAERPVQPEAPGQESRKSGGEVEQRKKKRPISPAQVKYNLLASAVREGVDELTYSLGVPFIHRPFYKRFGLRVLKTVRKSPESEW